MTRQELQYIPYLRKEIENIKERSLRLRSAMEGLSRSAAEFVRAGYTTDKLGDDVAALMEIEQELAERLLCLEQLNRRVDELLEAMPPEYRDVVRLRYCQGLKWNLVSRRTLYSEPHCKRIGKRFLDLLEDDTL